MFDLTGGALAGYLLRVARNVVNKSPRFRKTLGDTALATSNQISFGDVQVIVKDITSDGIRLSPDYFMATQTGRAIATQVAGKAGSFLEWATEIDKTGTLLDPGVYYMRVDWVKESNKPDKAIPPEAKVGDIAFTIGKFKWRQGIVEAADGTYVAFRAGIDGTTVTAFDGTTGLPLTVQAGATFLYLLSSPKTLLIKDASGTPLVPSTDYWMEATTSQVIVESTIFGVQDVDLPSGYSNISILDQDDYTLRTGLDYQVLSDTRIRLAGWTPAGSTLSIRGTIKLDPTVPANLLNTENTLNIQLLPGEKLVKDQVFVSTQTADNIPVTANANGTITLPYPLPPGGWCRYEVRIDTGETKVLGKRNSINPNLIPGLWIAVGDDVFAGDQAAIIISPTTTETYEVYGSKDNVRATIDVKANDLITASNLAELLKQNLLIFGKDRQEADGLSVYELSRSFTSQQRDNSGTAPTFTCSFSMSAGADWRVFVPLVTRVAYFNIIPTPTLGDFPGKLLATPQSAVLGVTGFLPDYR